MTRKLTEITLPEGTVKRIHVNRYNIAKNAKDGGRRPQWIVQTSRGPISCHSLRASRLTGSGPDDNQLACGARVYLTTRAKIVVCIDPQETLTKRAKELIE